MEERCVYRWELDNDLSGKEHPDEFAVASGEGRRTRDAFMCNFVDSGLHMESMMDRAGVHHGHRIRNDAACAADIQSKPAGNQRAVAAAAVHAERKDIDRGTICTRTLRRWPTLCDDLLFIFINYPPRLVQDVTRE